MNQLGASDLYKSILTALYEAAEMSRHRVKADDEVDNSESYRESMTVMSQGPIR